MKRSYQFVIFKPLSYCFEETIWFNGKASFASRPVSRLINWLGDTTRWYNKRILIKGYSVPLDFSWIENYKLSSFFEVLRLFIWFGALFQAFCAFRAELSKCHSSLSMSIYYYCFKVAFLVIKAKMVLR